MNIGGRPATRPLPDECRLSERTASIIQGNRCISEATERYLHRAFPLGTLLWYIPAGPYQRSAKGAGTSWPNCQKSGPDANVTALLEFPLLQSAVRCVSAVEDYKRPGHPHPHAIPSL
jgi:hypothetical protein